MMTSDDWEAERERKNVETIAKISIRLEDPPPRSEAPTEEDLPKPVRLCEDCKNPLENTYDDICKICVSKRTTTLPRSR